MATAEAVPGRDPCEGCNQLHDVELDVPTVADEQLQMEDLPALVRVLAEILPRHLSQSQTTDSRYQALRDLAHKSIEILSGVAAAQANNNNNNNNNNNKP
jgi:hypothetical protein